jgi:hypothetical protein
MISINLPFEYQRKNNHKHPGTRRYNRRVPLFLDIFLKMVIEYFRKKTTIFPIHDKIDNMTVLFFLFGKLTSLIEDDSLKNCNENKKGR